MLKHIVFALCSLGLMAGRSYAGVTFINTCGYVITTPGQYHLAQDLTCTGGGNGIEIRTNDAELHLDGHTVAHTGPHGSGIPNGILVTANDDSIFGPGTVTGFIFAVHLEGANGARIVNVTASNNNGDGILLSASSGNTLISNTTIGDAIGITILDGSQDNVLRANRADQNVFGILVAIGSTDNLIQANKAHNNINLDLFDVNSGPACTNTWKSNQFGTSQGPCIH